MSRNPNLQHKNRPISTFLFHQVNVGKGGPNMDIALQQAWEAGIHIVMIQEPWTMQKDGKFTTKSHPGFKCHIHIGALGTRPRAIKFTRKELHATQFFPRGPDQTADYCFFQIENVTFLNVYRAPGPSGSLEPMLLWEPQGQVVIRGDFNSLSRL